MSHYETLGVKPDASANEIKKAYRQKAKQHHPDKGGRHEDFAPVAKAYEVLSDPQRRLLYDNTGRDRRPPIEKEVESLLMQLFNQAIATSDDIPIVRTVTEQIKAGKTNIPQVIKDLKARRKKLETRRKRVTSKAATNIVHMIIDRELKNISAQIADCEHQLAVGKAALVELKSYSEDWEPPQQFQYVVSFDYRSSTGFTR